MWIEQWNTIENSEIDSNIYENFKGNILHLSQITT